MTFNIKKLAIASQADMPIKDPKGAPAINDDDVPLSVTLMSPGTRKYQSAKHKYDETINELTVRRMKGGTVAEGEQEKARAEFFATVTLSFNGFDYEGQNGYEGYKAAYQDTEIDLAEQVNTWLGDRGNFFTGQSKNSSSTSGTQHG
jgi:hypothetical protein